MQGNTFSSITLREIRILEEDQIIRQHMPYYEGFETEKNWQRFQLRYDNEYVRSVNYSMNDFIYQDGYRSLEVILDGDIEWHGGQMVMSDYHWNTTPPFKFSTWVNFTTPNVEKMIYVGTWSNNSGTTTSNFTNGVLIDNATIIKEYLNGILVGASSISIPTNDWVHYEIKFYSNKSMRIWINASNGNNIFTNWTGIAKCVRGNSNRLIGVGYGGEAGEHSSIFIDNITFTPRSNITLSLIHI